MTPSPSILSASANDRVSIERLADGSRRIANESGRVIVLAHAVEPLRTKLLEVDAIPRLSLDELKFESVAPDVELALCADGTVIILVGRGFARMQMVSLEIGDVGKVARSLEP